MKINQTLQFQVASPDEEEAGKEYKSRIADLDDEHLYMEIPIDVQTGKLKRLEIGDQLAVHFITEGGVKNFFESEVIGFTQDVIRLVAIRKPEPNAITRTQRRTFLRVAAQLEIAAKIGEHLQFLALTEDVGGGGVSFLCDDHIPLKVNDLLSCWLLVPYRNGSVEHAQFKGEIVRVKNQEGGKQLVMMRFADIAQAEQQKIIRYAFERQLDFRKK
ncbi:flagellar brake protein [Paenibacillus thermotolerans]|uniref:flagellar brake protein n=1 Tax=Paenibacillus thermotolerans TaxID=3027807 RepID=UPI00236855BD|nr:MULTISPECIES: flagellar brake domain-containing protein [unclassified Paenibacillus]